MSKNFQQGKYQVQNKEKYVGSNYTPRFLSSWEYEVFRKFDLNKSILAWGAEVVIVPYYNPLTQKKARYMVDLYVKYRNSAGEILEELVEIKPLKETKKPRQGKGRKRNTVVYETATYVRNQAKWAAATKYAEERGMKFRVISENHIFA